jgi:Predicted metal-dependent hydrolase with the TIM-barrel fold
VKDQRIVFVGSNRDATKFRGTKTRIIDLGDPLVPGLIDSHRHIFGIGEREMTLNLEWTNTRDDFLAKVKARIAQTSLGHPEQSVSREQALRIFTLWPAYAPFEENDKSSTIESI